MSIKVNVDMNYCQGHGECALIAPDVFELGDDDVLRWKDEVPDDRRADMEAAVDVCPTMAINLED